MSPSASSSCCGPGIIKYTIAEHVKAAFGCVGRLNLNEICRVGVCVLICEHNTLTLASLMFQHFQAS